MKIKSLILGLSISIISTVIYAIEEEELVDVPINLKTAAPIDWDSKGGVFVANISTSNESTGVAIGWKELLVGTNLHKVKGEKRLWIGYCDEGNARDCFAIGQGDRTGILFITTQAKSKFNGFGLNGGYEMVWADYDAAPITATNSGHLNINYDLANNINIRHLSVFLEAGYTHTYVWYNVGDKTNSGEIGFRASMDFRF